MKAKLIFTSVLILLLASAFIGGYVAYNNFNSYNEVTQQISSIESDKAVTVDSSVDYHNSVEKTSNEQLEEDFYYGYESIYERDGILYFSTTESWDEEKLSELADELYKNVHGEEMAYLEKVVVYGSYGGYAAGSHSMGVYGYEVPISHYNFFPGEQIINSYYDKSSIYIYGVDEDTTIEDIAVVLSHEYGHHFTFYHFGLGGNADDADTDYYNLRAEGNSEIIIERETYKNYIDEHKWYLAEIAAEDYVYFMGSDTFQNVHIFFDNYDRYIMYKNDRTEELENASDGLVQCRNGYPHENMNLQLPGGVNGLAEYFYSFVETESPYQNEYEPLGTLNVGMETIKDTQHRITWNQPYTDSDVIYTVLVYDDENELLLMLKTTQGDEEGVAELGIYDNRPASLSGYHRNMYIFKYETGKEITIRITVTFSNGIVLISDPTTFVY